MFTGIVETIGTVSSLVRLDDRETGDGGTTLTICNATKILDDVNLGDSIAVNGTCLTVTEFTEDSFKVGVAPETLRRTNLGELKTGMNVNLERAVAGHVRFGGHFVQGHVDTIATIVSKQPDGDALTIRLSPADKSLLVYVVEKGYITLDGASLTITAVDDQQGWFEVMLIVYTQEKTVIAAKNVGQSINIEVDMAGKYIEKQVKAHLENATGGLLEQFVVNIVKKELALRLAS
ncbi:riboflavin synthase alpha chain [Geopyxis carbonaria]|nr:riboflavin synthase alpha chain [Geopyxis carbonaria]